MTEEKAEIAARLRWTGTGIALGTSHPTPAAVRDAVLRVLAEPSFREAARRVQEETAAHDPVREAADLLEELVRQRAAVAGPERTSH